MTDCFFEAAFALVLRPLALVLKMLALIRAVLALVGSLVAEVRTEITVISGLVRAPPDHARRCRSRPRATARRSCSACNSWNSAASS